jgi:hypothetical protein
MNDYLIGVVNFLVFQILENGSYFPFLVIMIMMTSIVLIAHKNKTLAADFNFYDTLMVDGKAALEKMAAMLGYITITWWFIDACAKGKAGIAEAGVYGGLLIAARLGSKALDNKVTKNADTN